jgi:outer membrane receptor protein involved in Fe transport
VVCPADLKAAIANCTLGAIAFPFTGDIAVNEKYYEFKALNEIGVPFLVGNTFQMPPALNWAVNGTTSRSATTRPEPELPGVHEHQPDAGLQHQPDEGPRPHTLKAGFYINHSYKAQNFGAGGNGAPSFQGALNFGQDTNNPLDSGFGYSNAALGVFSSYGQQSAFIEGSFLYDNVEWYVQDNWKVSKKLTLDYGVRFVHQTPQYDQFNQVSTFRPRLEPLEGAVSLRAGLRGQHRHLRGRESRRQRSPHGRAARRGIVIARRQRDSWAQATARTA